MTISIYLVFKFLIFLNYSILITCESIVQYRREAGCSVLQSVVYCYGGRIKYESDRILFAINENTSLDLKQLNLLNNLEKKISQNNIQWKQLSTSYMGSDLSKSVYASCAPIITHNSFLIFGGLKSEIAPSSNPFIQYNVDTDSWSSYSYGNNFTAGGTMVNIGDDKIWIWGGYIVNNKTLTSKNLTIFDYKTSIYISSIGIDLPPRIEHTATLARDSKIYIIGGYISKQGDVYEYAKFTDVIIYDTITSKWEYFSHAIVTDHIMPSDRSSHSTVQIPNKDVLLIYGGENLNNNEVGVFDVCFLFNTTNRIFSPFKLPYTLFDNRRAGHFATVYNNEFLVILFGYTLSESPLDNIRVLNISNLNNASWLISPENVTLNDNSNYSDNDIPRNVIIIISVIVTFAVICLIGIIIWYFNKKKKLRNISELENEDPRKKIQNTNEMFSSNIQNENNITSNIYQNLSSTYVNDQTNYNESMIRLSQASSSNLDKRINKPSDIIGEEKDKDNNKIK